MKHLQRGLLAVVVSQVTAHFVLLRVHEDHGVDRGSDLGNLPLEIEIRIGLFDQIEGMTANLEFFRIKSADFAVKRIFKQHAVLKPSQCEIDMVGQRKINVLVELHGKMTLRIGNNLI